MEKESRDELVALRQLVLEAAREKAEFCFHDLTEDLIRQGLYGSVASLTRLQFQMFTKGVQADIKGAVKSSRTIGETCEFVCLEEGAKARWKLWIACTRREARAAYRLLRKKAREAKQSVKAQREAHIARFGEDPEETCQRT